MDGATPDGSSDVAIGFVVIDHEAQMCVAPHSEQHTLERSAVRLEDPIVTTDEDVIEDGEPLDVVHPLPIELVARQGDLGASLPKLVDDRPQFWAQSREVGRARDEFVGRRCADPVEVEYDKVECSSGTW